MYKIYINNHLLSLSSKPINNSENIKNFKYKEGIFKDIIKSLFDDVYNDVNIYDDEINKLWDIFKNSFKNIEAAGGIVSNLKNKYLLIKRNNIWDLPKGKIEIDELAKEAAKREVEEECGLEKLEIEDFFTSTYHMYLLNNEIVLKITYWYIMNSRNNAQLIPQQEEGITEVIWADKEIIFNSLMNNMFRSIKELFDNYFSQ